MATTAPDTSDVATLSLATATLPSQISLSVTSIGTDAITSAAAPTSFTTVSLTRQSIVTEASGAISTITYEATSVVTDAAQFSSLSSAALASASSKTQAASSNSASSTAAPSSKSSSSSPSLNTIVPAVIVPVLFLLAALALGWFLIKRRRKSKPHAEYTQENNDRPELDRKELPGTHPRAELNGRGLAEMPSSGLSEKSNPVKPVHELPASTDGIAELEGDATQRYKDS